VTSAYSWGLLIVNVVAFLWLFAHSPQHRWPVALMLCGQVAGRVLILGDIARIPTFLGVDLALLAVLAPWATYAIALLGFHILDPLPAAHQTALAQMREGIIVVDAKLRIASVNRAASAMLKLPAARAHGRPLGELLPVFADLPRGCTAGPFGRENNPTEVSLGAGEHWYAVEHSLLSDFHGRLVGHLLMLRDVTEQKRARTKLLEQERALATLRERERLAHELHDGVAQLLAAAHLQANTAKLLFARSQGTPLQACLEGLAETTLQAETELREYLLGVKTTAAVVQPLFPTLREYLVQYTRSCGIPVELSVPAELEAEGLDPVIEVQLVRIIQEALANVRKHARIQSVGTGEQKQNGVQEPCHAQVVFTRVASEVQVVIIDDGCGFDPAAELCAGSKYGFRSMEERAQAVGGSLCVISSPSQGTQVQVLVPWVEGNRTIETAIREQSSHTMTSQRE
jgi:signal transduction histidine kinase